MALLQIAAQEVHQRLARLFEAEDLDNARLHQRRIGEGSEVNDVDAVDKRRLKALGNGEGQAGLADPPRAGQSQQAHVRAQEEIANLAKLLLTTYQLVRRD